MPIDAICPRENKPEKIWKRGEAKRIAKKLNRGFYYCVCGAYHISYHYDVNIPSGMMINDAAKMNRYRRKRKEFFQSNQWNEWEWS